MALVKRDALVEHCKQQLGTPYVFGAKGEIMTQARIDSLAASYPSMFTSSYIRKAQKFIGRKCLDCSGLISDKTKLIRGSSHGDRGTSESLSAMESALSARESTMAALNQSPRRVTGPMH